MSWSAIALTQHFSWVTTFMLILRAYPSRNVKSIDLEDHNLSSTVGGLGKTCKNTFRLKLFKSWVTSFHGLPHSPRCTVITTIHAQCFLPDLNHDPRPVFPAGPQP